MRTTIAAVALLGATALAGCDNGGGGNGGDGEVGYADLLAQAEALEAEYGMAAAPAVLPPGSATYNGTAAFATAEETLENPGLLGQATLEANFESGDLTGTITDFQASDDRDVMGTLDIEGHICSCTNVSGVLTGTLDEGGVEAAYAGFVSGGLRGPDGEGLVLGGDSTRTVDGVATSLDTRIVAERD